MRCLVSHPEHIKHTAPSPRSVCSGYSDLRSRALQMSVCLHECCVSICVQLIYFAACSALIFSSKASKARTARRHVACTIYSLCVRAELLPSALPSAHGPLAHGPRTSLDVILSHLTPITFVQYMPLRKDLPIGQTSWQTQLSNLVQGHMQRSCMGYPA